MNMSSIDGINNKNNNNNKNMEVGRSTRRCVRSLLSFGGLALAMLVALSGADTVSSFHHSAKLSSSKSNSGTGITRNSASSTTTTTTSGEEKRKSTLLSGLNPSATASSSAHCSDVPEEGEGSPSLGLEGKGRKMSFLRRLYASGSRSTGDVTERQQLGARSSRGDEERSVRKIRRELLSPARARLYGAFSNKRRKARRLAVAVVLAVSVWSRGGLLPNQSNGVAHAAAAGFPNLSMSMSVRNTSPPPVDDAVVEETSAAASNIKKAVTLVTGTGTILLAAGGGTAVARYMQKRSTDSDDGVHANGANGAVNGKATVGEVNGKVTAAQNAKLRREIELELQRKTMEEEAKQIGYTKAVMAEKVKGDNDAEMQRARKMIGSVLERVKDAQQRAEELTSSVTAVEDLGKTVDEQIERQRQDNREQYKEMEAKVLEMDRQVEQERQREIEQERKQMEADAQLEEAAEAAAATAPFAVQDVEPVAAVDASTEGKALEETAAQEKVGGTADAVETTFPDVPDQQQNAATPALSIEDLEQDIVEVKKGEKDDDASADVQAVVEEEAVVVAGQEEKQEVEAVVEKNDCVVVGEEGKKEVEPVVEQEEVVVAEDKKEVEAVVEEEAVVVAEEEKKEAKNVVEEDADAAVAVTEEDQKAVAFEEKEKEPVVTTVVVEEATTVEVEKVAVGKEQKEAAPEAVPHVAAAAASRHVVQETPAVLSAESKSSRFLRKLKNTFSKEQDEKNPFSKEQDEKKEEIVHRARLQQPKSPREEAALQKKYASIESVEERAFQILLDLGMVHRTD